MLLSWFGISPQKCWTVHCKTQTELHCWYFKLEFINILNRSICFLRWAGILFCWVYALKWSEINWILLMNFWEMLRYSDRSNVFPSIDWFSSTLYQSWLEKYRYRIPAHRRSSPGGELLGVDQRSPGVWWDPWVIPWWWGWEYHIWCKKWSQGSWITRH